MNISSGAYAVDRLSRPGAGRGSGSHARGGGRRYQGNFDRRRLDRGAGARARERFAPQRKPEPRPEGDRCSPTCPLFVCTKRALMIKLEDGKPVAYCMWASDKCIGPTCQYASCKLHSQLPDGRCAQALRRVRQRTTSFEEELESAAKTSTSVRSLISRRGLDKDLESELC